MKFRLPFLSSKVKIPQGPTLKKTSYTLREKITGKPRIDFQDHDIQTLKIVASVIEGLDKPPLLLKHPLRPISVKLKSKLGAASGISFIEVRNDMYLFDIFLTIGL